MSAFRLAEGVAPQQGATRQNVVTMGAVLRRQAALVVTIVPPVAADTSEQAHRAEGLRARQKTTRSTGSRSQNCLT